MLHWDDGTLAALDVAIERALNGQPQLVVIHGGPGSGRSSLLATVVERATDAAAGRALRHRSTEGSVTGQSPLQGVEELGVHLVPETAGEIPTSLEAERGLREVIDSDLERGAVLVTIDDLQWIDPESVQALSRVVASAVAERLLVVATTGHFEPFQHLTWQRVIAESPLVVPIELSPLTHDVAVEIAQELRPELREVAVGQLREYTQGNPLYFTSLLRRAELADLERMEQLPAPDQYANAIWLRLAGLGEEPIALAQAASVIGNGWMPLAEAAYVAGIADPTPALDVLESEFILEKRTSKLGAETRLVHAVIQASIYQHIPIADRVGLHARAAEVASDQPSELRHRYAAAATYDEDLAQQLVRAADAQSRERSHRLSAVYLDWAARISRDGLLRSQRGMDSFYEWILAGSIEFVRDRLPDIRGARDRVGAALVQGTLDVVDNEWLDAVEELQPVADAGEDTLRAARIETLLAWASLCAGRPGEEVLSPLRRAAAMGVHDDSLAGLSTFTASIMAARGDGGETGRGEDPEAAVRPIRRPASVSTNDTYRLAWLGIGLGLQGRIAEAVAPLREVDARMATGLLDVGDGLTRAFLGLSYLLGGSPELAALPFRTAEALQRPRANPMTASIIANWYVHNGDLEGAERLLAAARSTLLDMPWDEGVNTLLSARVTFLQAFGSEDERASLLGEHRRDFGIRADDVRGVGPLGRLQLALALVWASEFEQAEKHAAVLDRPDRPAWRSASAAWIRGLIADRLGDLDGALELLGRAVELDEGSIPSISAHLSDDLARVARAGGRAALAGESEARAHAIYARIGAVPYLSQTAVPAALASDEPASMPPGAAPSASESADGPSPFALLSERERDVAALITRGMSYAQIARELYITRSTVGFHLQRIYAKTGTTTRHELSELLRQPLP